MTLLSIDFQKIRSFGGSQNHAFEELCSQLASLEPRSSGDVFYRKGVGADAGVECFLRHRDQSETGWQVKYFFQLDSGQIAQLNESVEQALKKHPRLTRYVVCIPFDLLDQRVGKAQTQLQRWDAWAKKWKATAARKKRKLAIELWSKSALVERLGRDNPLYSGRAAFWFNETLLTSKWFEERFAIARANLGQRYTPETNIELPIRRAILGFCRDPSLLDEIERWQEKLAKQRRDVIYHLKDVASIADWAPCQSSLEEALSALGVLLSVTPGDPDYAFPIEDIRARADEAIIATARFMRVIWSVKVSDAKVQKDLRDLGYFVGLLDGALSNILDALDSDRWRVVNPRRVLVTGVAGAGKSHLFGDAVDHQVRQNRPAILVLGGSLIDGDLWPQIVQQLGLTVAPSVFLGSLDAAAQAAGTRAVIFIDAINERHGIAIWSERLAGFLKSIEAYPRVAVALSCRTTYLPYILRNGVEKDLPQLEHVGFAGRAAEAARVYLDRRGIVRMAAPNLIPEFENPLFLKTCCDYLEKEGIRELPRGLRGVTEIFGFYTEAIAKAIELRLGFDRRLRIVARALEALANAFDQGERGYLEYEKAAEVLNAIHPSDGSFERSLLAQLVNEGVLADEPVAGDDGEPVHVVRFSFERYSDHRISKQLLDRNLDAASPSSSFVAGTALHEYLTSEDAYQHAGVIEAMAIQLPERCGMELPDAVSAKAVNRHIIIDAFLNSVLWRNQKAFTQRTLDLLKGASRVYGRDDTLRTLIAISTEPENAFNAFYLHDRLMPLSMPERDQHWSIFVAEDGGYDDNDSPIETLITWTLQNGFEEMDDDRAELAAVMLGWFFSTSQRSIRDRATKALAALLSKRLEIAARILLRFRSVSDPYVLDRVMAASYGAALQGMTENGLTELAQAAYEIVFDKDEPTPHVLIRDYARGIIELADMKNALPPSVDLQRARPPHRSAWPLEEVSKETIEGYKQDYPGGHRFTDDIVSSAVNDGDFARYVSDGAIDDFSTLPIAWVGRTEEDIFQAWITNLDKTNPIGLERAQELIVACNRWRAEQQKSGGILTRRVVVRLVKPGDVDKKDERTNFEKNVDESEERLRAALSSAEWEDYRNQARHYVRQGLHGVGRHYQWPPSFDVRQARHWICKRAHDLGWTPERFGEFDRRRGHSGDRYNHRLERIGKKYQWIAFHELLARLSDNVGFIGWRREDGIKVFKGPWQVNRRDMDPSLFASRMPEEKRQSDRTWWMPVQIVLRSVSPHARLTWLDGPNDIVNDASLLNVVEPLTAREWLVVHEYEGWTQWGVRDGDRDLERQTWFSINCVLVRTADRDRVVQTLVRKILKSHGDFNKLDIPSEGYVGEYPWHPLYDGVDPWIQPDSWNGMGAAIQPAVTEYLAERSGHDYSIEDTVRFNVPAPGLFAGLKLRLTNGRDLTYAGENGRVLFFDPSTKEPGPSAALVDREAFLAFLKRENLEAIWAVTGAKEAFGGKRHGRGFGGSRNFASIYWLSETGFQRRDVEEYQRPTKDQLEAYFDEEGADDIVMRTRNAPSGSRKTVASGAPKGARKNKKKVAAKRPAKKKKQVPRKHVKKRKAKRGTVGPKKVTRK